MIQITRIGAGLIAFILVVGFMGIVVGQYEQNQTISHLQQPVVVKTVVVTPTNVPVAPTATPAATLKVVKPLTK